MPSPAAELTTVTVCSLASVVSCSRGCKPSTTPLPISSLGQKISTCDTRTAPIRQHILFKTAVLVYKCRHGLAPSYLSTYCIPMSSRDGRCHLCCAVSGQLSVPHMTTNYGDHSGPVVWNNLPAALRLDMSLSVFRRRLKTFFMTEATDSV